MSLFPRRYWSRWALPAAPLALLSSALTAATGVLVGLEGFLRYAARVAEIGISVPPSEGVPFDPTMALEITSVFAFALGTPLGMACTYMFLSGVGRAVTVAAGSPAGDPIATLVDGVIRERLTRRAERRDAEAREAREGPAVPDVLVPGEDAGFPTAEWVVIASRLKEGWDRGVFVVTTDRWYKIGARQDRETPEGLRAFYPLESVAATEVIRRSVYYDHPRLSAMGKADADEDGGAS